MKWGRRDLNPRSTDISGAPRNSRGSSTRPMISRPLGISVWSVVPGASLWSQSPCLAWPQPRVISHQTVAETRIKGFRSKAIEGRRRARRSEANGSFGGSPERPATALLPVVVAPVAVLAFEPGDELCHARHVTDRDDVAAALRAVAVGVR